MAEPRRFARFRPRIPAGDRALWNVPDRGLCLSAFVILHERGRPERVLVGKINPAAPWERLGALDPDRRRVSEGRWILPASQLLWFESPDDAASRVGAEMLGRPELELQGPDVYSEAYGRDDVSGIDRHWDLQFVFHGELDRPPSPLPDAWSDLRFVEVPRTPRSEFGRNHGDVLELVGLAPS